ncbi:Wzz/FepE/Etk N-terminal domain-containing protein [Gracilimonas sp. BCB1]|uniref:Wzz/FepE/Etk N-terminal domain-containing protein n=1 Tax=Gracilimonas sp. BCB1 TaxID=3152362 RepID=UPI0032D94EDD
MSEENNSNQEHGDDKPGKKKSPENFPIQEYRLVPADHAYEGYEEDEIDLIELAKTIWDNRKVIYRFVAVGVVLGVAVALLSPKEYVSDATLMPEYSTESQGGASSLLRQYGGLIGLSGGGTYNSASNAIRVDLYPKIVQSLSFQDQLARQQFYFPDYDTTTSIYNYYLEVQTPGVLGYMKMFTVGLPGTIIGAFKSEEEAVSAGISNQDEIVELTKNEMEVITALRSRVSASLDEESGVVTVRAQMSNPKLAASVAKYTIDELTEYLVEYRTEKVIRDLEFIEEQLNDARERFREAQLELADFDDSNQGNLTARAQTERQRLQSEYDIAFNLYNSLTQQFEEAKLKVQEETPVFKVLQPVQVPVNDETSGAMVLIVFVMLSGIASIGWIFIRQFLASNPFGGES